MFSVLEFPVKESQGLYFILNLVWRGNSESIANGVDKGMQSRCTWFRRMMVIRALKNRIPPKWGIG